MSSFGDGNNKTIIEQELSWVVENYYDNFHEDTEVQRRFVLDVLDVLRYMCDD